MGARVTGQFVGRRRELAELFGASERVSGGAGELVLVAGDAGIGKSRLTAELSAELVRRGWLVAQGVCVELAHGSVAFSPFAEVVRHLIADLGAETFGALASGHGAELAAMIDGGGGTVAAGRVLELAAETLRALSAGRRVAVIIEDIHWADPSTLDLIRFLGANLRRNRVLVVATLRSDDVHRKHRLRPVLAEMARARVPRVDLEGLPRDDAARLARELTAGRADATTLAQIAARAEGNPFFLEELAALAGEGRLPDTVADAVLARVDRLPESAMAVLRPAAVIGRGVHERLLHEITGLAPDVVSAALRGATDERVLSPDADGRLQFRHDLIREVIYDDMLPDERARLHATTALALEGDAGLVPSELVRSTLIANHWVGAGENTRAFAASVKAGRLGGVLGHREAVQQFERALALWQQHPDPEDAAGTDHAGLMVEAATACQEAGEIRRAIELAEAARAELESGGGDATRVVEVLLPLSVMYVHDSQRRSADGVLDHALALLGDAPSALRTRVLTLKAALLMRYSEFAESVAVAREALKQALAIRDRVSEAHARNTMGTSLAGLGLLGESLVELGHALRICSEIGDRTGVIRAYNNRSWVLILTEDAETALTDARAALDVVRETGSLVMQGSSLLDHEGLALLRLGRWDEAVECQRNFPLDELAHVAVCVAAGATFSVALRRGDIAAAQAVIDKVAPRADSDQPQVTAFIYGFAAELALALGHHSQCREYVDTAVESAMAKMDAMHAAKPLWLGLAVERADHDGRDARDMEGRSAAAHRAGRLIRHVDALAADLAARGGRFLPEPAGFIAMARAEYGAIKGDGPALWGDAVDAWTACADPYWAAYARFRRADATLLAKGSRADAHADLVAALAVATELGAGPLAHDIRELAKRARLVIDAPGESADTPDLGLTEREQEVLALVAAGLTNPEIAERLFITSKTASVHVSNLLRKLGVDNRLQAAAIANRTRG